MWKKDPLGPLAESLAHLSELVASAETKLVENLTDRATALLKHIEYRKTLHMPTEPSNNDRD